MTKAPYDKLQIRELDSSELEYPLALCQTYHWPLSAQSLKHASQAGIFLGLCPSKEDAHLFEKEGTVTAPHLLGTIAFFPQGSRWSVGYVLVDPAHHRNGLGTLLMKHGIKLCQEQTSLPRPSSLFLSATDYGAPVYERVGFKRHEESMLLMSAPCTRVMQALSEKEESEDKSRNLHTFDPRQDPGSWSKGVEFAGHHTRTDLKRCLDVCCLDESIAEGCLLAVLSVDNSSSKVNGFGIIRPYGSLPWNIGPIIASSLDIAKDIFCQLIKARSVTKHSDDEVIGIAATSNKKWLEWLKVIGLGVIMSAVVMSLDLGPDTQAEADADTKDDAETIAQWCYIDGAFM
jgi:predicted GNAT family N-acyltransferase